MRTILIAAAAVAGLLLAVRAAIGPFAIHSPFGAETVLWLALLGLLAVVPVQEPKPSDERFPRLALALVLVFVTLAFLRNLSDSFLSDDYIITTGPRFTLPGFLASFHTAGGDGSFRPLGALYFQTLLGLGRAIPAVWHAVGLTLHLLNCTLVFAIAWMLWRRSTAASIAALAFGLHGTRPEAALWTAGNFDLLACACALGSILVALHSRRRLLPAWGLLAIAILFKESAYATPLIALLLLERSRPYLIGAVAVCAGMFAWRWHLFHGPGGYLDPVTGHPAILTLHPLTAAKALFIRIWNILLIPVNWDAPVAWWLPVSIAAVATALIWMASAGEGPAGRLMRLRFIAATICAVLPAIHLALIGQSVMGSRVLYLAGAPFGLLVGSLTGNGRRHIWMGAVLVLGMLGILENNLNAWHANAIQAHAACERPTPATPVTADGVFLFQNGYAECIAAARR